MVFSYKGEIKFAPELDKDFRPIAVDNREYVKAVEAAENTETVKMALIKDEENIFSITLKVMKETEENSADNIIYIERKLKTLLWLKGGWKVVYAGPEYIGEHLKEAYAKGGKRDFDADFMGGIYGKTFSVEVTSDDQVPETVHHSKPLGKNWNGYRIGFDVGGSDRKVSAVIEGEPVYCEEVVWHPKMMSDPEYHYNGILESMETAASKMPRVDAIGVSAAGIYIDNQVKAASLFLKVSKEEFEKKVRNIFLDIAQKFDVPIEVANDGDVTALAGAMSLDETKVLGIAMGTSEAAGYVDANGNITGWLNELAFVPVDYNSDAMEDEWSHDIGCGVKYFSQDGVIKLTRNAGIKLDESLTPAEKLKAVQGLMEEGDVRAAKIYESIGCYLGYTIAYYAEFYDIKNVLIMGRVTSGEGGMILIDTARKVVKEEFPEYDIKLVVPDEKSRRLGQSVAAASLPKIK